MSKNIVNIINFVRGTEPRLQIDLLAATKKQLEEVKKLGLRATFLLQYDALADGRFVDLIRPYLDFIEVGLWIELVRECIEKAGEAWRGIPDWQWDWHGNICNTVGYSPDSRKRITDVCMEKFKEVFGFFPASVGAWAIDAVTLEYLDKKYRVSAACNCKEQWGTDGYTLWGGYYGQAYYPSKYNSLCPARTNAAQINIPVFRMLGSDPIYQYDAGLNTSGGASEAQPVVTLEPVYTGTEGGGGISDWVDWYFSENFNGKCLSFSYTQAGQENSFGWERMEKGFLYQMKKIKELSDSNRLEVMTLGETGRWYKDNYKHTPASVIAAENDWKNKGRKSYWYCSKNYRTNLYFDDGYFWIRDLFIFDENYRERYLDKICQSEGYVFDTLPVVDGNRFSGDGVRGGLYVCDRAKKQIQAAGDPVYLENEETAVISVMTESFGKIVFKFLERRLEITAERNYNNLVLTPLFNKKALTVKADIDGKSINLEYNGFKYSLELTAGVINNGCIAPDETGTIAAEII